MTLLTLLVALIFIALMFWAVKAISAAFAVPPQIVTVVQVLLVVIVVIWLLQASGLLGGGGPVIRLQ